jgi:hypothetical protein
LFAHDLPVSDLRKSSAFCAFCSAVDGIKLFELAIGNLLCVVIAFGYKSKIINCPRAIRFYGW